MSFMLSFAPLGLYPGFVHGSHFTLHFYFFNVFPPFHYHLFWNFLSSTQTKPNLQFLIFAHPLQKKHVYILSSAKILMLDAWDFMCIPTIREPSRDSLLKHFYNLIILFTFLLGFKVHI